MVRVASALFLEFSNGVLDFVGGEEDFFLVVSEKVVVGKSIVNMNIKGEGIAWRFIIILHGISE